MKHCHDRLRMLAELWVLRLRRPVGTKRSLERKGTSWMHSMLSLVIQPPAHSLAFALAHGGLASVRCIIKMSWILSRLFPLNHTFWANVWITEHDHRENGMICLLLTLLSHILWCFQNINRKLQRSHAKQGTLWAKHKLRLFLWLSYSNYMC